MYWLILLHDLVDFLELELILVRLWEVVLKTSYLWRHCLKVVKLRMKEWRLLLQICNILRSWNQSFGLHLVLEKPFVLIVGLFLEGVGRLWIVVAGGVLRLLGIVLHRNVMVVLLMGHLCLESKL